MADKQTVSIELYPYQVAYLEEMASKHGIPDLNKAVRVLINFARDEQDHESIIFSEKRCIDCGRD